MTAETKFRGARFGVFEADLESRELRKHGVRIKLTGQPFQALSLLLEHACEVVTREDLREALWPNESWGEHDQRLNKIVNKIREALCDSAESPRYLETIPRIGYRFLMNVELFGERHPEAPVDPGTPSPEIPAPTMPAAVMPAAVMPAAVMPAPVMPVAAPAPAAAPSRARWLWLALAACLIVAALVAAFSSIVSTKRTNIAKVVDAAPLTTYVGSELYPALSPDGKTVTFAWDGESKAGFHIYTASVPGGAARQLTDDPRSDSAPVWSPNGQEIAFLRDSGPGKAEVWLVNVTGKAARKVREIRRTILDQSVAWTADTNWLVLPQRAGSNGSPSLFLVSAKDGREQQITFTVSGPSGGDLTPVVSPDGKRLAFTRSTSPAWRDVFVVALGKDHVPTGEPVRLTNARTIIDHIAWTPDGRSIVFSAATTLAGSRHLYRVDTTVRGTAPELVETGIEGSHPTLAGSPFKLAFVRKNIEQSSIWRLQLDSAGAQPRQFRMLTSTRRDYTTDLSPDGTHIVFSSVRSGPTEIWMSEPDGSNLKRLTSMGGSTPRWSPNGERIAFESNRSGQSDIYILTVQTGAIQRLTTDGASNKRPSWSRDGRFIYFASDRTGRMQIWKAPGNGGDAVQITRHGGQYAIETFDGKSIYYTTPDLPSEVWTTSVNGGDESPVLRNVVGYETIASAHDGFYYFTSTNTNNGADLNLYRFSDRASRTLASIEHPVHRFLSSSADGRAVLYSQVDKSDSDLMVVDPFR